MQLPPAKLFAEGSLQTLLKIAGRPTATSQYDLATLVCVSHAYLSIIKVWQTYC
jgi:hypothetical protein